MMRLEIDIQNKTETTVALTDDERQERASSLIDGAWIALRDERNRRLLGCDWTQVADAPVDNLEWAGYRQALRDLPANTTDPTNPVWPTPPA